jgi:hypothetical protein
MMGLVDEHIIERCVSEMLDGVINTHDACGGGEMWLVGSVPSGSH